MGAIIMTPLSGRLAALTGADDVIDIDLELSLAGKEVAWLPNGVTIYRDIADHNQWCTPYTARRWTSDLNVVVAEIERRGWRWATGNIGHHAWGEVWLTGGNNRHVFGPTPCLALLRALVSAVEMAGK
jgi:hypothetical protein